MFGLHFFDTVLQSLFQVSKSISTSSIYPNLMCENKLDDMRKPITFGTIDIKAGVMPSLKMWMCQ